MMTGSFTPATFLPSAALAPRAGFRSDARFVVAGTIDETSIAGAAVIAEPAPDHYAQGWAEGHAAALADAQAEIARRNAADAAERDAMRLAMTRIDAALEARLGERLRETVAALCEATLAPLALDPDVLAARVTRAAAMLVRAENERVVRLHPDDLALLIDRFDDELTLLPDASLARGAVRVEGNFGGIEDGPEQWHEAIAAALTRDDGPC